MALTRKMLKAMGIEDEKIDQIIEAHTETIDALKEKAEENAEAAKKLGTVQKELDDAKKDLEALKKDTFKDKYDDVKKQFDDYKKEIAGKEAQAKKEKAYKKMLKNDASLNDDGVEKAVKYADWAKIEIDEEENVKNAPELIKAAQDEWKPYVVTKDTKGADPAKPPVNTGTTPMSKKDIMAIKNPVERQQKIAENINLFQKG